ncbi:MAG: CocE/NonD family hydrolase [Polyangiales bacterium]
MRQSSVKIIPLVALLWLGCGQVEGDAHEPRSAALEGSARVSKPGDYQGYGERVYDGYALSSQYVEVRDGVRLAIDLYRPKERDGRVTEAPLPVVWMHTPYNRRTFSSPAGTGNAGDTYPGTAAKLVDYGYVVAIADFRGLYASFGTNRGYNRGEWVEAARFDAYDITEWLAKQPFSNGKVGMWGCSATGGSQMQAATTRPPSLKAIFPMSCEFDAYPFGVPGGMSASAGDTKTPPGGPTAAQRDQLAVPVDADTSRAELRAAVASHASNVENPGYVPFRDSVATQIPEPWWIKSSPHTYLDALRNAGIGIYAAANWDEAATKYGAFFTVNNLPNTKLVVGPGAHCAWSAVRTQTGFDIVVEERRFFDHWLKGIDNQVMSEDKVHYYTYNADPAASWKSAAKWPLPSEVRTDFYLGAAALGTTPPSEPDAADAVAIDYGAPAKSTLTYETAPLASDLTVTGHPTVALWTSSTATDGDYVATLYDVAPDGTATTYHMHGRLRASLRKEAPAPYDNLSLPYHPSGTGDVQPLVPGTPTQLHFDLLPISIVFRAGHRVRLVLSFAEATTPRLSPAPTVTIHRDAAHASKLVLPVIPPGK